MIFDNFEDGWAFILDGREYDLDDLIDVSSGNYTIEIMTDEGCVDSYDIDITESMLSLDHSDEYSGIEGDTVLISLRPYDPGSIDQINWTSENNYDCLDPICSELSVVMESSETMGYEVRDTFGCLFIGSIMLTAIPLDSMKMDTMDIDTMTVDTMTIDTTIVDPMPPIDTTAMAVKTSIYLPNALKVDSPINGTLCVYATSDIVTVISFRLYDRWGNLHFDESGPIIDGRYCVSNSTIWSELQSGVYVYAVELQKSDGDTIIESGNVTVFK
jgi:hypothetical protein